MNLFGQEWFWTNIFPIISTIVGALLALSGIYLKEKLSRKTQIKLEKLKLYDNDKLESYKKLYSFISLAFSIYWPPDEPEKDFSNIMKHHFFKEIKPNYPYYEKKIREKLKILESQYECLGEPDFIPGIPFDEFFKNKYLEILNELNKIVESNFDNWEKN